MSRTFVGGIVISLLLFTVVSVRAQDTTAPDTTNPSEQVPKVKRPKQVPNPPDKPPDMVCFGDDPKFSIQFVSWGARYLGINQPNQDFPGSFFWAQDQKVWQWQQENNPASVGGGGVLLARVQKASCTDPGRKGTFPFAVVLTLPQGDMLSGCCRILNAGEAPAAPKRVPSNATPAQ